MPPQCFIYMDTGQEYVMSVADTAEKIKNMEIRGAGKIARSAAGALSEYSAGIAAKNMPLKEYLQNMHKAADILKGTRPTAVSLPNAVNITLRGIDSATITSTADADRILQRNASEFIENSKLAIQNIAEIGARYIKDGDTVMTHCNSNAAISCMLKAHEQGRDFEVFATEVRPRNQGYLTIKTLSDAGIKTNFIVDSAVRYFMKKVSLVITGCDAVTVNGAVINKIGTSQIALCAQEARVPFIVVGETYKFAPKTVMGGHIDIEERDASEIMPADKAALLKNVTIRNPAFDVTPAEYVDYIITEKGAIPPAMAYLIIREHLGWEIGEFDTIRNGKSVS